MDLGGAVFARNQAQAMQFSFLIILPSVLLSGFAFPRETMPWIFYAIGAVLLFIAAKQTKFWGMFWTMLAYSVFYTATLPLVNKMLLQQLLGAERFAQDRAAA